MLITRVITAILLLCVLLPALFWLTPLLWRVAVCGVLVIAGGHCINCAAGEGNPIEVMDLSLSLQASAAEHLAENGRDMQPGLHRLPEAIETELAAARIRLAAGSTEPMTPELERAMQHW